MYHINITVTKKALITWHDYIIVLNRKLEGIHRYLQRLNCA